MTATKVRLAIAAGVVGFIAVEQAAEHGHLWAKVITFVLGGLWICVASFFAIGLLVYGRRYRRSENTASKATAIQALPFDDEPVTLHYPEGGETR